MIMKSRWCLGADKPHREAPRNCGFWILVDLPLEDRVLFLQLMGGPYGDLQAPQARIDL